MLIVLAVTIASLLHFGVVPRNAEIASPLHQPSGFTAWPRHAIYSWSQKNVGDVPVVLLAGSAYAAIELPGYPPKGWVVERIGIANGRVLAKSPVIAGVLPSESLVAEDGWIWVAGHTRDRSNLYRLRATNLAFTDQYSYRDSVEFPDDIDGALAASAGFIWFGAGRSLVQFTSSGHEVLRLDVGGSIASLALDATSGRLYDVLSTSRGEVLQERNATDGALLARHSAVNRWAVRDLTADVGGVWVSLIGGMSASLARFSSPHLDLSVGEKEGVLVGTKALRAFDAGHTLWWVDSQDVECLDPASGRTIARTVVFTAGGLVQQGQRIYITTPTGISVLAPPSACF
jgi:outer membrane protein assembly factor BamB